MKPLVLVAIWPTQRFNSNVNNVNDNYTSKVKLVKIGGNNNPPVNPPVNPPSDLHAPSNFPSQNVPRKSNLYIPIRSGPHLASTAGNNDPGKPDPDPNSEFDNHQKKQPSKKTDSDKFTYNDYSETKKKKQQQCQLDEKDTEYEKLSLTENYIFSLETKQAKRHFLVF